MSGDAKETPPTGDVDGEDRIIILKSDDCERSLGVKQSLLTKSSKYFEGCLAFKTETPEVSFDSKIVPFAILEMIVRFLEFDKLEPNGDTLERLFVAADYLQIESALKVLYDYLEDDLTKQDPAKVGKGTLLMYLRILNIVQRYVKRNNITRKTRELVHREKAHVNGKTFSCKIDLQFIVGLHFNRIRLDKAVFSLDVNGIYEILGMYCLSISEEEVLSTIKMWVNYDYAARKQHFEHLLKCVRYSSDMKTDFVLNELLCYCKSDDECLCLTSEKFVIAYITKKEGIHLEAGIFELNTTERLRGSWRLP